MAKLNILCQRCSVPQLCQTDVRHLRIYTRHPLGLASTSFTNRRQLALVTSCTYSGAQRPAYRPQQGNTGNRRRNNGPGGRGYQREEESGLLINEMIEAREVRLLDQDKTMIGVLGLFEALNMAADQGVDVVCISPDANPPVCRLVDANKYKYELEKAEKELKKKQRESRQDMKELKMRLNTDIADYQLRVRSAQKFLANGDKVKLTVTLQGREMAYGREKAEPVVLKFVEDLGEGTGTLEALPRLAGRQVTAIIVPTKTNSS